ncbi:MAG: hypothetical protein SNG02_05130 [Rikenellaceae bacterium]
MITKLKNRLLYSLSVAVLAVSSVSAQTKVYYVSLDEGAVITPNAVKEYYQPQDVDGGTRVGIYPQAKFQTIDGFGGAFNEIGGEALMSLPKKARQEVVDALFSPENSNFTLCRTAIGASDFGRDGYSYSEVADDYEMKNFSVDREKKSVIPAIKMAQESNPQLSIFASPWSPPAWMKHSGLMDQGDKNKSTNKLIDKPEIYEAYALYFAKYVEEYKKNGVAIDRIVVQNETDIHTKYPSCVMTPDQLYKVITYMRPLFDKRGVEAEIWAGTFRSAVVLDMIEYATNPDYMAAVDGVGMQYTSPQFIYDLQALSPSKPMMHTEGACFNSENTTKQAFSRFAEVAGYINSGVQNYCYWNMILDETKSSGWGWPQNSLVVIDMKKGDVVYTPDYAVMSLFGRFIKPGSVRVASKSRGKDPIMTLVDGDNVNLFVKNESAEDMIFSCYENDKFISNAVVPASSIAVITYKMN